LIYNLFGPTYPGTIDETNLYTLFYPGISFIFAVPESFLPMQKGELPFLSRDNATPVLTQVLIYQGKTMSEPIVGIEPGYFEPILIHNQSIEFTNRQTVIKLFDTPQDLLCELGPPNDQVQNEMNRMGIHDSDKQSDVSKPCDYIWNYFILGLDFVFDGTLHRLKKVILHTNALGHHEMLKYGKCNFSFENGGLDHRSTWKQIKQTMGNCIGPPVIFNKDENPFGPTSYYSYNGILFEILKNDYVASVTLFLNE
jgi:hypothetical protein